MNSTSPSKASKPAAKKVAKKAAQKTAVKKTPQAAARKARPVAAAPEKVAKRAAKPPIDLAALPVTPAPEPAPKQKTKLVRDSFTMPQSDFALIDVLKERSLNMKHPVKKSELLRAGLQALNTLDDLRLLVVLEALEPLKAGRPKKD